jgi:BASS family bile acid:Na+ symporter
LWTGSLFDRINRKYILATHPDSKTNLTARIILGLIVLSAIFAFASAIFGSFEQASASVVSLFLLLAIYFQFKDSLKTFTFTCLVFAFFLASLVYPNAFLAVGGFDQRTLIVPLIQIIMFGMGATLNLRDFSNALKMPRAVFIGMVLQFAVMPATGWALALSFGFEAEVAAGIILIGSCPGGVASNVMTYLAQGNVALSVTMTACSTALAPFMTPLLMKLLAGRMIEIDTLGMFLSIVNLIILPIAAGLAIHYLLNSKIKGAIWRPISLALALLCYILGQSEIGMSAQITSLAAAFLIMSILQRQWLEKGLPLLSMIGICYIVAIIAANTRDSIMAVGLGLFVAAIIHNSIGYISGYGIARLSRLPEKDCRTVAFEVGLQNGGMGSALAMSVLKSSNAALGSVIFGTWMNLSGSMLASWWKGRPSDPPEDKAS